MKANFKVTVNFSGKMGNTIKDTSVMVSAVVMACGREQGQAISIRDNLKTIKKMAMVFILGHVVISTKETIKIICGVDTVRCIGKMEAFIEVTGSSISLMEKEKDSMEHKN